VEVSAHGYEINIQTLASSTKLAQAIALEIFEVYSPALFVWRVGGEVVLGCGRPLTDSGDVMPDLRG
jgi:hypothetical protein